MTVLLQYGWETWGGKHSNLPESHIKRKQKICTHIPSLHLAVKFLGISVAKQTLFICKCKQVHLELIQFMRPLWKIKHLRYFFKINAFFCCQMFHIKFIVLTLLWQKTCLSTRILYSSKKSVVNNLILYFQATKHVTFKSFKLFIVQMFSFHELITFFNEKHKWKRHNEIWIKFH